MKILTEIYIFKEEDMILLGKLFTETLLDSCVVSLEGELGSGKTTFVKGAGFALNIDEEIISPTFVILREYRGIKPLYHFDFYRLSKETELFDIDFFDVINFPGIKFIEWGDKFLSLTDYYDYVIRFEKPCPELRILRIYSKDE